MFVELDGEQYFIQFQHDVEDKYTTATLWKISGKYSPEQGDVPRQGDYTFEEPEIAVGEAMCHWKDNYVKKTGRMIALTRLLDWMTKNRFNLSREERGKLWLKYFENFKK